uniref:Uncharacterized protein n=1 Tax=viral metagenome TaxID=1070528 RepID=A0A6C0ITW0_9ZZZZ
MDNYSKTYGAFESKIMVNGQPIDSKSVSWEGNDEKGKMSVNVNDNGKQKSFHLDNKELLSLMKISSIGMPLEKRLETELLQTHKISNKKHKITNKRHKKPNKKHKRHKISSKRRSSK